MSVNSTGSSTANNIWASLGIKSNGIGGLVSGLNTDELVQALTTSTRNKIAQQGQQKQLLNWKMTAYRSMATALRAFQKKSFSYSSSAIPINSSAFFNTFKTSSTSDKVEVKTTSTSAVGSFTIDSIRQLATAQSLKSTATLSSSLTGADADSLIGKDFTGQTLTLDVDGDVRTIKLDDLGSMAADIAQKRADAGGSGAITGNDYADALQSLIDTTYGTKSTKDIKDSGDNVIGQTSSHIVEVSLEDGKLKLDSDAAKVTINKDSDALSFTKGHSNRVSMSSTIGSLDAFKDVAGDVLKFEINGVEISVKKSDTLTTLKSRIDNSGAGATFDYNKYTGEFTLTSKKKGAGENLVLQDTQGNLMNTLFGAKGGAGIGSNELLRSETITSQSTNKAYGASAAELNKLASNLSSMEFSMTIDGVTKIVKADMEAVSSSHLKDGKLTESDVINAFNQGIKNAFGDDAGVQFAKGDNGQVILKNTYNDIRHSFSVSSSTTSSQRDGLQALGFTQTSGNSVLNLDYGNNITASSAMDFSGLTPSDISTFSLTVNGETKQIEVKGMTSANAAKKINEAVAEAFGKDIAAKLTFSSGSDDKLVLDIKDTNLSVQIGHGTNGNGKVDALTNIGFAAPVDNYNAGNNGTKINELVGGDTLLNGTLTINGQVVNYDKDMTLQDLVKDINDALGDPTAARIENGQLRITSKTGEIEISDSNPGDGGLLTNLYGIEKQNIGTDASPIYVNVYKTADATSEYEANVAAGKGKNAEIVIDGRVMTSATNTFTINNVEVTVNEVSDPGDKPITIGVSSNPDEVVTRLKDWITDYNALISTLNAAIYEEKDSAYTPLSDEQKAGMTADQIKTWETEAKKGILRSDSTLRGIVSELRNSLYQKVEAAGISLYDIGITTKPYTETGVSGAGQLEITEKGEEKLRAMLESNPDKVRLLFTDPTDGLAARMNTIIDKAAKTSSIDRGSLVTLAGTEDLTGDNTSSLSKKLDAIDKYVSTLKLRLENEYNRYWKQFSALELAIQKMSAQSSWLTSA